MAVKAEPRVGAIRVNLSEGPSVLEADRKRSLLQNQRPSRIKLGMTRLLFTW